MQLVKTIFVGFLVSFIGSIPLGYLNIIGFKIYQTLGINSTVSYLAGIVFIEFFVVYFTLNFANKLIQNKQLLYYIEAFSVLFMFVLAFGFYATSDSAHDSVFVVSKYSKYPFLFGIILSCTNFVQLPFWTSWNLYLLNENYIETTNSKKYFYVLSTTLGTFLGMFLLILSLNFVVHQMNFVSKYLIKLILPIVFIGFGSYQGIKFYNKYC